MKIKGELLKIYILKIVWLASFFSVAWFIFSYYQTINEAILNPPPIEQNQVSERQGKLNTKLLEDIKTFHAAKTKMAVPAELERDPFSPLVLDTIAE